MLASMAEREQNRRESVNAKHPQLSQVLKKLKMNIFAVLSAERHVKVESHH